jgi:hypothetical protein
VFVAKSQYVQSDLSERASLSLYQVRNRIAKDDSLTQSFGHHEGLIFQPVRGRPFDGEARGGFYNLHSDGPPSLARHSAR